MRIMTFRRRLFLATTAGLFFIFGARVSAAQPFFVPAPNIPGT